MTLVRAVIDPHMGNTDDFGTDCRPVEFPHAMKLKPYTVNQAKSTYLLGGVIALRTYPGPESGAYVTFLAIFGQWVRIGPDGVLPLDSHPELDDGSGDPWSQFWTLLLYVRAA
jgi:hypothetical protein